MKRLQLLFCAVAFPLLAFSQAETKQLARVNKNQGKEVYVMCEPVRDYEVVEKVNSAMSQLLGVNPTIPNMVNAMIDKAVNKEKKGKIGAFDALVTSDGTNAILIKFKDTDTDKKSIGRITKAQGKEVYVMCEPLSDYETIENINSAFAQVLGVEPSIEKMVQVMVDKAVNKESKGKVSAFDAIISSDGETSILVKFKDR